MINKCDNNNNNADSLIRLILGEGVSWTFFFADFSVDCLLL